MGLAAGARQASGSGTSHEVAVPRAQTLGSCLSILWPCLFSLQPSASVGAQSSRGTPLGSLGVW